MKTISYQCYALNVTVELFFGKSAVKTNFVISAKYDIKLREMLYFMFSLLEFSD